MMRFCGLMAVSLVVVLAAYAATTKLKGDGFSFSLPDLEGNLVSSEDGRFKEKVVLVDIWGTWCPNCRTAVPSLVALQEKYRDEGLFVVGVNFEYEEDPAKRVELAKKGISTLGINYLILDGGHPDNLMKSLPDLEKLEDIPTVILSGRDGVVRFIKTGFKEGDEAAYEAAIQAALAEEKS